MATGSGPYQQQRRQHGGQWLIDPLWHDETLFASGLKYFNQHGTRFVDSTVEQLIPNEDTLFYRYRSQHKDGVVKYFSHAGLLILQKDRFGNRITFEYQEGAKNIEEARLAAITDNYGNRYTFHYEPGVMVVHYPDARAQKFSSLPPALQPLSTQCNNAMNLNTSTTAVIT